MDGWVDSWIGGCEWVGFTYEVARRIHNRDEIRVQGFLLARGEIHWTFGKEGVLGGEDPEEELVVAFLVGLFWVSEWMGESPCRACGCSIVLFE